MHEQLIVARQLPDAAKGFGLDAAQSPFWSLACGRQHEGGLLTTAVQSLCHIW